MFGTKATLFVVYIRRKRFDLYDSPFVREPDCPPCRGLFGLRYQPHHLIAAVFAARAEAVKYADRLLSYRQQQGVRANPFHDAIEQDDPMEYRWPTGPFEFEAVGIMSIVKRGEVGAHQPLVDRAEAQELTSKMEDPYALIPLMLTDGARTAILAGAPINRDWIRRDGMDWARPLDEDACSYAKATQVILEEDSEKRIPLAPFLTQSRRLERRRLLEFRRRGLKLSAHVLHTVSTGQQAASRSPIGRTWSSLQATLSSLECSRRLRPNGAQGCSHGWSAGRPSGGDRSETRGRKRQVPYSPQRGEGSA